MESSTSSTQDLLQGIPTVIITAFTLTLIAHSFCRQEEAALRLVLERREAELRRAMKLRHRLTTLLHALRLNMEHVG